MPDGTSTERVDTMSHLQNLQNLFDWLQLNHAVGYVLLWLICGLCGVAIYRFIAGGPCNPFGEWIERRMFWTVFLFGPLSLVIAIITVIIVNADDVMVHVRAKKQQREAA
jgi:hypothetical protein